MARRVSKVDPKTKEELVIVIQTVWDELDQETINGLVAKFPDKLEELLRNGGSEIR
jgi:uncharacterized protein (DUF2267 family)